MDQIETIHAHWHISIHLCCITLIYSDKLGDGPWHAIIEFTWTKYRQLSAKITPHFSDLTTQGMKLAALFSEW